MSKSIVFTLYTTADTASTDTVTATDRFISTTQSTLRIDGDYTTPDDNKLLSYQVLSGPGTLYVGARDDPTGTAAKSLIESEENPVFLYLNRGESRVRVYLDGGHPEDGVTITYDYTGTDRRDSTSNPTPPTPPASVTPSITVSSISLSGAPGTTQSFTATATTAIRVSSSAFTSAGGSISVNGSSVSVTLPNSPGSTYNLVVSASGYRDSIVRAIVTGIADTEDDDDDTTTQLGTLNIAKFGTQVGTQQQISVTASPRPTSDVSFRVSVNGVAATSGILTTAGRGSAILTVPTTGLYSVSVSATGYTTRQVTFTAGAQATTTTPTTPTTTATPTTTTPTPTVSEPASIQISGSATRSGSALNQQLDAPLLVQVLDDDGDGVADARVIFRVRSGQGRLSQRGNGRAVAVQTDSRGFGRATYTPMSASSTVEVEARGVTRTVTFTISTGSAPPTTATTTRTTDTGVTPGTINPVVHIPAANRPSMLWVDDGAIYALIGASPQRFAPSVDNALNLTIGAGKIYWTEKTGDSAGTINSANLDGTGVTELTAIRAVPMGIAVDETNSMLYWTNSRGRIQSANLDGSSIKNVMQNLSNPVDIALAGGNAYWTEGNHGSVRFVNLKGQKQVRVISTGTDPAGSLAIAGGKVYWTEQVGESGGTVNSANLNGSGEKELVSIQAAPMGIAVDTARSKLFWTNARGRIQSANLNGSGIRNVVDGLGSPREIILGNSIQIKTTDTTTTKTTPAKANYDVDSSGGIDNVDVFLVALAVGTSNTKYDVNGDGKVDDKDIALVRDNRDSGAAAAPMIVGAKLSAEQVDRLQAQIDLLVVSNDRSPATLKTLVYLQQLIATARPEKTQLLANYPNPFNPETWIPYELAADTNVRITIYTSTGVVVRSLILGHQSAGYYTDRERAAHWDGQNTAGEQVASGIYFYQLETDGMSLMRKMVILK